MKDSELGRAVRDLTSAWLEWHDQLNRHERHAELAERVEGYRIVDGGQTDSDGSWEIVDAETREALAHGIGRESYDAAWQDSWFHVDALGREANEAVPDPAGDFGLPAGLAHVLREWVVDRPGEARRLFAK